VAYRVFLSHGWADRWVATQIERRIRSDCGAETFIDVFDIKKGDDIEGRIFSEMHGIDELVVLFTPWSVERNWLWVEIGAARVLGKRVVAILYQVSFDSIDREKGGATFLRAKNAVDINDLDTYLSELRERVRGAAR